MLTRLTIKNFKLFHDVDLELGNRVVLIGPNNAGKTSALQALALWDIGVKRWSEKRGSGDVPEKRPGVTINRRDLITVPVPVANLLWRDLHTQESSRAGGTQKIFIDVLVEGVTGGSPWTCGLEFYYANEESFYCRSLRLPAGGRMDVPQAATDLRVAYLPPMSGLSATETRLDEGAINVRLGEGRTADVLRNLCYRVAEMPKGDENWSRLSLRMQELFGVSLNRPEYVRERGEIVMSYRMAGGIELDISASGRGQQQTLLLLAHMTANPGAILLLDEPDAHLEILRQRQIYQVLTETAEATGSQILAASHSEVFLNEAADRDVVIAFVGKPHRIDDRGQQVLKALNRIGFEHYYQAEEVGWVLYLEGSTDLAILRALAKRLGHAAAMAALERPFVHYVANQPRKAQDHFYGVREAKNDLVGLALYDHLDQVTPPDPNLDQITWTRRELENYLCQRETLLAWAAAQGGEQGELFRASWRQMMEDSIREIEAALKALGRPSPWEPSIKASDEFFEPLFKKFYEQLGLPNLMRKTDYHTLAVFVDVGEIAPEVRSVLDRVADTAARARPRRD